ncbi:uncharacterized protein LOC133035147 [Cannabis sativa]|uniref:uncharacterized protein LOC133035147 n=1 Tax=Cannabis sativa TaxID=3483 RepID=UPI0029C9F70B|nr:uncharacterized protein LOC133035147 [Cannabis sativa]
METDGMTWREFEEVFREQYFSPSHGRALIGVFDGLRQGDMTVNEFYMKFVELSSYAYLGVVDQPLVIEQFMRRLRPAIRGPIAPLTFNNLTECVTAALRTEAHVEGNEKKNTRKGKGNDRKMIKKNQGSGPKDNNLVGVALVVVHLERLVVDHTGVSVVVNNVTRRKIARNDNKDFKHLMGDP